MHHVAGRDPGGGGGAGDAFPIHAMRVACYFDQHPMLRMVDPWSRTVESFPCELDTRDYAITASVLGAGFVVLGQEPSLFVIDADMRSQPRLAAADGRAAPAFDRTHWWLVEERNGVSIAREVDARGGGALEVALGSGTLRVVGQLRDGTLVVHADGLRLVDPTDGSWRSERRVLPPELVLDDWVLGGIATVDVWHVPTDRVTSLVDPLESFWGAGPLVACADGSRVAGVVHNLTEPGILIVDLPSLEWQLIPVASRWPSDPVWTPSGDGVFVGLPFDSAFAYIDIATGRLTRFAVEGTPLFVIDDEES